MMTPAAISPAQEGAYMSQLRPATLGEALRLLQARTGLNRDQLATEARISQGAMSNYLNDVSMPSAAALRRVVVAFARWLSVEVDDLWREVGAVLDDHAGMAALDTQADVLRREKGKAKGASRG